jgi:aquaporin Z
MQNIQKFAAETMGTMVLVLLGCGSAVLSGLDVGWLGISFAFGLAVVAMAYTIGGISGCHINPAISFGAWVAGRMSLTNMIMYWIAQVLGAIIGAAILWYISTNIGGAIHDVSGGSLGSNGVPKDGLYGALAIEFVLTFIFVAVVLGATSKNGAGALAGLVIGLTLVVIHIVSIRVTGTSVNPARSIGPALVSGDAAALANLWVFIAAPLAGAFLAGIRSRMCDE